MVSTLSKIKFKKYISEFDLSEMVKNITYGSRNETNCDVLELLFVLGAKVDDSSMLYSVLNAGHLAYCIKMFEILVINGGLNVNERFFVNGIYKNVTCLTMFCSRLTNRNIPPRDQKELTTKIIKLLEFGGDMSIVDHLGKDAYDYLPEFAVDKIDKKIKNFKNDYELNKTTKKYNL